MDAEHLRIFLTVLAAVGVHLGVRWYIRHGLARRKPNDWEA
ncbi:hypothetical protein [Pseudomonas panipatensis]|jgi:hypothetical protein|uniref:Uncharacterized protein n=1 Tax=Pseudomonas panipatensis TaxID=428992 RepID=A0A1G8EKR6_9PSED|nr:hypothetical protein [Pseudomonas panipatensis]SDH70498.1 hypothetical protein SAMN05216272_102628 [Pseudomonas panipatensis]SMP68286.1 hypothetical protein SAMN06295951_108140 [Pseudomonas panipatensis]